MKREAGFYWVRTITGWTVAELSPFYDGDVDYSSWYICGCETSYLTNELEEINETRLNPPGSKPDRTVMKSIVYQSGQNNGR